MKASILLAFAILVVSACGSSGEESAASVTSTPPSTPIPKNYDALMVEIAQEVPGFAGFSEDAQRGVLLVRAIRDDIDLTALRSAIAARFPLLADMEFELLVVDYQFNQLAGWYERIPELSAAPGLVGQVSYTDIDEANNAIRIGVLSEGAVQAVYHEIARMGIPKEAVLVVVVEQGYYPMETS